MDEKLSEANPGGSSLVAHQARGPAEAICPYCSGRGMVYMRWSGWYAEFPSLCGYCGGTGTLEGRATQERG